MTTALRCAECGTELTTADADHAVATDAGPVHRECFEGPVPPPALPDDYLADEQGTLIDVGDLPVDPDATPDLDIDWGDEEAARRAYGDQPLDPELIRKTHGEFPVPDQPMCPECRVEPALNGGRCFTCRGRSML